MEQPPEFSAANKFEGEIGSVVQVGTMHGDLHLPGWRNSVHRPYQLPPPPADFVNRQSELLRLDAMLDTIENDANTRIAVIAGPPGIGKSALTLHWAHSVRDRFPGGQLYIDMRGYGLGPTLQASQVLDAFLRSFGIPPDSIPIDLDERASLFRSTLSERRLLIVIDNLSSAKQVRYLLPASPRCMTLITSRSSMSSLVAREGAIRMSLDVLSTAEAVQLLSEAIDDSRPEDDQQSAIRIAERCGHLPLALRVVAERAVARPHVSLRELADELESEQSRLDSLTAENDPLVDVRAVFSWSYHSLSPELRRVFRFLGLHRGTELGSAVAAALVADSPNSVKLRLAELAEAHLIQQRSSDRYGLHDLLRAYSVERCQREEPERVRTQTVRRMMNWYLHAADKARRATLPYSHSVPLIPMEAESPPDFIDAKQAMEWFAVERLNLLDLLAQAMDLGQYDIGWKLPIVTAGLFELGAYWNEWRQIHQDGLVAAETVGDDFGTSSNLLILGDADRRIGNRDAAFESYERCEQIARNIGHFWLEGFALRGIGLIHEESGSLARAQHYYKSALEIFRSNRVRRGEGMVYRSLASVHAARFHFPQAVDFANQALTIFEEIGDTWTQAWGQLEIGRILREANRFAEADDHLRRAIEGFRQFNDLRNLATGLEELAVLFAGQGDAEEARGCLREALDILEPLNDPRVSSIQTQIDSLPGDS